MNLYVSNVSTTLIYSISFAFQLTPDSPLHAVSPTFSTRVPKAPATTPATIQASSPTKSAPLLRDTSGMMMVNPTPDWPPREKSSSPLQMLRAPVNTPGSMMQDVTGKGN